MIHSFRQQGTEDIFNGKASKAARATCRKTFGSGQLGSSTQIDSAVNVDDLKVPPGNRLELLKGDRVGQYSIRINDQYRICFGWSEQGATEVEIIDYH